MCKIVSSVYAILPQITGANMPCFSLYLPGLLQFSAGPPPQPEDTMTLPAHGVPHVTVREEDGEVRLLVIRAQGLLGRVMAEYRTVSLTAFSPADYQVNPLILLKQYIHLENRRSALRGLQGAWCCTCNLLNKEKKH